jgi:hypothetical protein
MSSYSLSSSPAREAERTGSALPGHVDGHPAASSSSSSSSPASSSRPPLHHLRHLNQSMLSGAGAGLISSVVTCPLDVLKTRLQAQMIGKGQVGYEGVIGQSPSCIRICRLGSSEKRRRGPASYKSGRHIGQDMARTELGVRVGQQVYAGAHRRALP